jgi:hypothetical protein
LLINLLKKKKTMKVPTKISPVFQRKMAKKGHPENDPE